MYTGLEPGKQLTTTTEVDNFLGYAMVCNYTFLQKEGHFLIQAHIKNASKEVESLSLINTFLVDEIMNHVNIIHFRINEQLRSFKMDKNRQKISLVFD